MSVFMPAPHYCDDCSFVVILESEYVHHPTLFFFCRMVCLIRGPLHFHISAKKKKRQLVCRSVEGWGGYCHLHSFNSSYPWIWDIFPFIQAFINLFKKCFLVFTAQICTSLINFFLFDAIVNRNIFLISFSDLSCNPTTLLNWFIGSDSVFVDSLECPVHKIVSSANRVGFTSSFPIPFNFFFLPLHPGLNLQYNIERNGENRHPCRVCDLVGKLPVFHYYI